MIRKWIDYFAGECDTCGEELANKGILYLIKNTIGICVDCYESVSIYLVDVDIDEIHEEDCNCQDCIDEIVAGVAAMGPEDME